MASYSLRFKPSVEKDLQSIPRPIVSRILDRIGRLPIDPFPPQSAKLQGAERLYRLRVGDYRIVYEVDREAGHITVHYVRHGAEDIRCRNLFCSACAEVEEAVISVHPGGVHVWAWGVNSEK